MTGPLSISPAWSRPGLYSLSDEKSMAGQGLSALKKSPVLGDLSRDLLEEIETAAHVRQYARKEFIFAQDEPMDFLYIVREGRVKLFVVAATGKSYTYSIAHCGDTLHGIALFSDSLCKSSAQAMDPVTLMCLKKSWFLDFVNRHPDILVKIINILGRQVHNARQRLLDTVTRDVRQRLINTLNMLYGKFGATIHITNEELSELAGTTTETTIRIMGQLRKSRIIRTNRGQVHIIDPHHLNKCGTDITII